MSGLNREQLESVRRLQEEFLARGGQVKRMPIHAATTGNMRFNYARKAFREADEARRADQMQSERDSWSAENGA